MISVNKRNLTSENWTVYNEATKRLQYSTAPTSAITAETVMVGGFALLQEVAGEIIGYQANALNQHAMLSVDDIADFIPSYDAAGNQTRVKTSTGIWAISYDAENRPTDFTRQAVDVTITTVHCEYDYMGRRATEQVATNGSITLHQRYIYRGYLQIAALDLTRSHHPALWYITWDATQPVATRPLAIQKDGTWYTYGWDLSKNICEVFGPAGYIRTAYTYAPYGEVTSEGDVTQPIQWSSEFNDTELGLIYYNYRHYNPVDGRWIGRDKLWTLNSYAGYANTPFYVLDYLGNEIKLVPTVYKAPVGWNGYRERSNYEPCNYVGISNEKINQITKLVEKLNAIKCRNIDRNKYQIDIYTQPINMEGVKRLPWDGYKKAILASHTSYVSKNNFIIENHGIKISSRSLNGIKNGSLNVYGCHLSGKPKGELTHAQTMERIIQYLNTLDTSDKCDCEAPYKIQLVSGNFSKHFTGGQYYYD